MKIALIANSFPKLSETFILNEAIEIKQQGVDLEIIALNKSPDSLAHDSYHEHNLAENLKVISNYDSLSTGQRLVEGGKALFKCLFHNPLLFVKAICGGLSREILRALVYASGLGFKVHQYDVIYCHFGNNALLIKKLMEIGYLRGRLAVVFHGFDISSFIEANGADMYQESFDRIDYFLPISHFWQAKLESLGVDSNKIYVHRMGIDLDKFAYQQREKQDKVNFISVCRLTEKKGIIYAVEALGKLKGELDFDYFIVGDGKEKADIEAKVKALGLTENVHMLGAQTQDQVIARLKQSHIMLAPSVTAEDGSMEGIPVVIMEAMAQGVLVASTYHSGIPELVRHGETGFLSEERDVDDLVSSIQSACDADWYDISTQALKAVSSEFVTRDAIAKLIKHIS